MATTERVVWVDRDHDRTAASDGNSRLAAYLLSRQAELREAYESWAPDGIELAAREVLARVLRIAQPPVMSPGFLRTAGGVGPISLHWNDDAGWYWCVTLDVPLAGSSAWATWEPERVGWSEGMAPVEPRKLPAILPRLEVRLPAGLERIAQQTQALAQAVVADGRVADAAGLLLGAIAVELDEALRPLVGRDIELC